MVLEIKDRVLGHFLIKVEELPGSNDLRSFSTTFEIVNPLHYQVSGPEYRVGVNRSRDFYFLRTSAQRWLKTKKLSYFCAHLDWSLTLNKKTLWVR